MTTNGPAYAGSNIREIADMERRIKEIAETVDSALNVLGKVVHSQLDEAITKWGDVPARVARIEELLTPLTVDPADPDLEYGYLRSDGRLVRVPADPDQRATMIADGIRLYPMPRSQRADGRMEITPPPQMVKS